MFARRLRCSFCRRDSSEVAKLVAGPGAYICDRCAYETVRIMETTPGGDPPAVPRSSAFDRIIRFIRPGRPMRLQAAD
jgi:ClpX C4-type zinc finger